MAIYYKATDPHGRDFYTGMVQFTVGESVPAKPRTMNPECCSSDVYHASLYPHATLIGGVWPCRLFEVEGEVVVEEGDKRGFYTFKVIREIEAWRALGPNGREVAALIDQISSLAEDGLRGLAIPKVATWDAARDAARGSFRDAARGSSRDAARDAAWNAARGSARGSSRGPAMSSAINAVWGSAPDVIWDATVSATWDAAREAAMDATRALLVRDLISEEQFNVLYNPWASVMEGK